MTTREDIIAAAKEAGFLYYDKFPQDYKCKIEALYAIAFEAGRVAEREECAKVCERRVLNDKSREDVEAKNCAAAIRARSTK